MIRLLPNLYYDKQLINKINEMIGEIEKIQEDFKELKKELRDEIDTINHTDFSKK